MAEKVIIPLEVDSTKAEAEIKDTTKAIEGAKKEQTLFSAATDKVNKAFGKLKGGVKRTIATFKTLKGGYCCNWNRFTCYCFRLVSYILYKHTKRCR